MCSLNKKHYQYLCYYHPYEHTQRINSGIADAGLVAFYGVVGIAQCHWVSH